MHIFVTPVQLIYEKLRFDPNFYLMQDSLKLEGGAFPIVTLGEILSSKPQYGANSAAKAGNPQTDPRYIRITDIDEYGNLRSDGWMTASEVEEQYMLHQGDLLIARSGNTVGKSYIFEEDFPALYAGYMIRFIVDKSKALPKYVFYYTQTPQYKHWVAAHQRPSGQPNINAQEYQALRLPLPPLDVQAKVIEIMDSAYQQKLLLEREAEKLVTGIDSYLWEQLGIQEPQGQGHLSFVTGIADMQNDRLDPEYYKPRFSLIASAIEAGKYKTALLSNVVKEVNRRFKPEKGKKYDYVQLGGLDLETGEISSYREISLPDVPSRATQIIEDGDIVFSLSAPQMGNHFIAHLRNGTAAASSGFVVLDPRDNDAQFITTILKSGMYRAYFQKFLSGAGLFQTILTSDLMELRIPNPPIQEQKRIGTKIQNMIGDAIDLRKQALQILPTAQNKIQSIILGNHDTTT